MRANEVRASSNKKAWSSLFSLVSVVPPNERTLRQIEVGGGGSSSSIIVMPSCYRG